MLDRGDVHTVMTHMFPMCNAHTRLESFAAFGTNQAPRNNAQAETESQFEGRIYEWLAGLLVVARWGGRGRRPNAHRWRFCGP